jgi:hypothetical protein
VRPDAVPHATRTAVEHHPHLLRLVEAHLDEVVARPERSQVDHRVALLEVRIFGDDRAKARRKAGPGVGHVVGRLTPRAAIVPAEAGLAVGHGPLDGASKRSQRVGQVLGLQGGLGGHHPAADVDADRRRDDRPFGRDHRTDGGAEAKVHVGHHGHPRANEGEAGGVVELAQGAFVDRHSVGPTFDRDPAGGLKQLVRDVVAHGGTLFMPRAKPPALRGAQNSGGARA